MANEKKNLRKELRAYKFKFDLLDWSGIFCLL